MLARRGIRRGGSGGRSERAADGADLRQDRQRPVVEALREGAGERRVEVSEPVEGGGDEGERVVAAVAREAGEPGYLSDLEARCRELESRLDPRCRRMLEEWPKTVERYRADSYRFTVRGKTVEHDLFSTSLSGLRIPKVALPRYRDWGDLLTWMLTENAPGFFPFAAGVFPLKRRGEDPARQFAGEGGSERTNRRFHYLARGMPAKRLSTAFDSVTLYGEEPARRPDVYGKVGNSGVSIATVDDAKKLYSGFDLADPKTSVSMTINGPAPMILAYFLNAAIDQGCEKFLRAEGKLAEAEQRIARLLLGH